MFKNNFQETLLILIHEGTVVNHKAIINEGSVI